MPLLTKARQIVRTHGLRGLIRRGIAKLRRDVAQRANARSQRYAWDDLISRVRTGPVFFPRHEKPLVSIVIPAHNQLRHMAACLNAVLRELDSIPCEVIVVDDASTDGTAEYLESCSGIRIITHATRYGVIRSLNDGAAGARGRYLHFLSSDTIVTPGWMVKLLRTFESGESAGAAGSQVRGAGGRVLQAGALVWKDGTMSDFGRGRHAKDPAVSFPRNVDYCSSDSIMVRADLFRQLGGFSTDFESAPEPFKDADLCMRLRENGYHVMYQPGSIAVRPERPAGGTDDPAGAHCGQFAAKWCRELTSHFPPDSDLLERAARRLTGEKTALVIDSFIPFEDRSAGGRRLLSIMKLMRELGWHVIFIADDGGAYEPYTSIARTAGIEVIPHRGDASSSIMNLPVAVEAAWVSRPDVLQKYLPLLHRRAHTRVVYDTVDLHFLRLQREAEFRGHETNWTFMRQIELDLCRKADCTVVTSGYERDLLAENGIKAHVVPIIEQPVETHAAYSARNGVLFLGNYTHEPNVDAVEWLVQEIMPRVWERNEHIRLILAGAEPTPAVQRLAGERVEVAGYVRDVRTLFAGTRVFAAPLRFGAGMKGKIVQSLAHGVPVVTTRIGAEGIGLTDNASALIAETPEQIAGAILRAYNDESLWSALAAGARQCAQPFTPDAVLPHVKRALDAAVEQNVQIGVDFGFSTHSA